MTLAQRMAAGLGVAGLAGLLLAWVDGAYVDYSDGVYALTARMLLGGSGLYTDVVAAQPPVLLWLGAALLAIDDSITALRVGMVTLTVVQALLVAALVRRLAGTSAALFAAAAALFSPWTLREFGAMVPERLGAPLLLGAALLAARPHGAVAAGMLAAVAVAVKVAFVLPAAAVLLAARRRGTAVIAALATGLPIAGALVALYGRAGIENIIVAQAQSGTHAARYVAELWAQAAWTEGALLALALLAWRFRANLGDAAQMRVVVAAAAGSAALLLTLVKDGSFLQVLLILEPVLVVLAAAGVVGLMRAQPRPHALATGAAAATALVAAQSISVLARPTAPALLAAPWSAARFGWTADAEAVAREVARARRCPPEAPHPGPPYVAFRAGRSLPGGQADPFILEAPVHADVRAASLRAGRVACPADAD